MVNSEGEVVCNNCGLVQDYNNTVFGKGTILLKDYIYESNNYINKVSSTPSFIKGSYIKYNKFDTNKKIYKIQNNIINSYVDNRVLILLSEINNIFNLGYTAKYKVLNIYTIIRNNINKKFKILDLLTVSLIFYYRNIRRGYSIKYIISKLRKNGYNISARKINKVLFELPAEIRNKYKRHKVEDRIDFCISRIFNYLRKNAKNNIDKDKINLLQLNTLEDVKKYCELRTKLRKSDSSSYDAFICKIIYDKLKSVKNKSNRPIITYKIIREIIEISACSVRNANYKDLKK